MALQKRDCGIQAHIEPLGAELLHVAFDFGNEKLEFTPSSAMGGQLGDFICALYTLFHEENNERYDGHSEWRKRKYILIENHEIWATTVTVEWDGEGPYLILEMTREWDGDVIRLRASEDYGKTYTEYTVNDRDFCYAVAKAYTEAIKKFGFYGFRYSTEGEPVMLHQLLFIKAYALGNTEARYLTVVDEELDSCSSDFEKEMELLLFDM